MPCGRGHKPKPDQPPKPGEPLLVSVAEAIDRLTGKSAEQIFVRLEPHGDGYIVEEGLLGLVSNDTGEIVETTATPPPYNNYSTSDPQTSTGAGVTCSLGPTAATEVWIINFAQLKHNDAAARDLSEYFIRTTTEAGATVTEYLLPKDSPSIPNGNVPYPLYPVYWDGTNTRPVGYYPLVLRYGETLRITLSALANTKVATLSVHYTKFSV